MKPTKSPRSRSDSGKAKISSARVTYGEKGLRLARIWETMLLLVESPQPLTAPEIHRKLHNRSPWAEIPCTLQTTREDLRTLRRARFPVAALDHEGQYIDPERLDEGGRGKLKHLRWSLADPRHISELEAPSHRVPSIADLKTLSLCRALLNQAMPLKYPLYGALNRLLESLQQQLNEILRTGKTLGGTSLSGFNQKLKILGRVYTGSEPEQAIWDTITTAIAQKQVLIGQYQNRTNSSREVDIAPLAIWFAEGRAYTLAAGATDRKIRAWRLDRFDSLRLAKARKFPEIDEATINAHLQRQFGGMVGDQIEVVLKVDPSVIYLFHEYQFHPSQKIDENTDGGATVTIHSSPGWPLEEWVLGFGEKVQVIYPEEFRARIVDRLKMALTSYESPHNV